MLHSLEFPRNPTMPFSKNTKEHKLIVQYIHSTIYSTKFFQNPVNCPWSTEALFMIIYEYYL